MKRGRRVVGKNLPVDELKMLDVFYLWSVGRTRFSVQSYRSPPQFPQRCSRPSFGSVPVLARWDPSFGAPSSYPLYSHVDLRHGMEPDSTSVRRIRRPVSSRNHQCLERYELTSLWNNNGLKRYELTSLWNNNGLERYVLTSLWNSNGLAKDMSWPYYEITNGLERYELTSLWNH